MTLRLGFVGCGKWARKLAESFRACGAEIVAYDRQGGEKCHGYGSPICDNGIWHRPDMGDVACVHACDGGYKRLDGFGKRAAWRDQLSDKSIDAIIAVAPPGVTTEVAMACAAAGKAVCATKPLFDHPERITAPFYVDFWRLWSNAHQRVKSRQPDNHCAFSLTGSGPVRDFPGIFDYGPHVMAAILDIGRFRNAGSASYESIGSEDRCSFSMNMGGDRMLSVQFGNGYERSVRLIFDEDETPTHIGAETKEAIMQKFCRAFMADVTEGHVDPKLLNYSRDGMALLNRIRESAT